MTITDPHPTRSATTAAVLRVVVVDDHELVRGGLRHLLSQGPGFDVVGEAARAEEAVRRIAFDEPDVAILDLDLPDGSGIDVCRRVRQISKDTRVVILTAHTDPDAVVAAREAGASTFVLKRIRDFDLVDILERVAAGETAFEGEPSPDEQTDSLLTHLTRREISILEFIAEGMTNRQIADTLFLAEKTGRTTSRMSWRSSAPRIVPEPPPT